MQRSLTAVSGIVVGTLIIAASMGRGVAYAQGAADPVWPTTQWQISTPEEQGMESAALANLIDFGKTRSFDSLLIARHGKIVLDAYYAPCGHSSRDQFRHEVGDRHFDGDRDPGWPAG